MKNDPWQNELVFGAVFILLAIISSLILNNWLLGLLIWMSVYIIWKWIELYHFYKWFSSGANLKAVPINSGIWRALTKQVLKNKKLNKKTIKKNKFLLHQFETTAQALPYATILLNSQFEIQWSNKESYKLLGILPKHNKTKIVNFIQNPNFLDVIKNDNDSNDIKIDNPTDTNKQIHIRLVKLSNKTNLLVVRDISEQESLRNSRKAFVDNASHELRTPLTVITGYLEMLDNNDEISTQWKTAINQAQAQSIRMEKIIDDMLKLSSMEHERYLERDDENIKMPHLLNNIFNDIKNSKNAKNYILTANVDSELSIHGDEGEIISLTMNLINNALIHNPKQTNIQLKWYKEENQAHLWVCDDGNGIDKKHLTHLTERFYRVDNSRNKNSNSTGLGLAIVKQICINHQAQLEIKTDIGKGTCFKIIFPNTRIV